ncbi:Dyp-type peroxidase [Phycicoccus sonneratiae]|uniref:Dyp-type peroxidase n=1 Tax=Phycicoccus sonneratiae TaxID=2807628 RepID=A0ABS2CKF9_9MICO|nr:Dyp-type peroxidase [Phycicoccus sonneraticus]MBM6400362.1 Dyp-type peroxidase [Phycicoccus sonneraticus]
MTDAENAPDRAAAGPRRRAVLLTGLVGAGAGVATGAGAALARGREAPPADDRLQRARASARAFRGEHQAGILEAPPPHASFVALDLREDADRDAVRRLLTVWTDDVERLMAGRGPLTDLEPELAAVPASLTVTVGVGPRVVALAGAEKPSWLAPLPAFPEIDRLEDAWSGGDLLLQVCADSPTTVSHAQRRLTAAVADLATVRWVQRGFREPFEGPGLPMRNLLGQVDGTVQPDVTGLDAGLLWVGDDGPAWLRGGSSVVVRRIGMRLDAWDRADRLSRENAIGRRLDTGAPVTGGRVDTAADLEAKDELGFHVVDDAAHLRRAHATAPHERFLRRPYSYDDGTGAETRAGLVFVAFQADPVRQLVPVQRRLAELDLLNLWTVPVGSAVFAVLPGARPGEVLGEAMFA